MPSWDTAAAERVGKIWLMRGLSCYITCGGFYMLTYSSKTRGGFPSRDHLRLVARHEPRRGSVHRRQANPCSDTTVHEHHSRLL